MGQMGAGAQASISDVQIFKRTWLSQQTQASRALSGLNDGRPKVTKWRVAVSVGGFLRFSHILG